ncbi:MAG: DUF1499 domain-containing protein [Anaerolineae bacterium]
MKVSLIPWEPIWLASLACFIILAAWSAAGYLRGKKPGAVKSAALYLSIVLAAAIPAGATLLNYRFDLDAQSNEATRLDHSLPDLQTRRYREYTAEQVFRAALRAVQAASTYGQPWTVTFAELKDNRTGRIAAQVPVLFTTHSLAVTIQTVQTFPGSKTVDFIAVDVYSAGRPGSRDLGENARHIKQFYRLLHTELAADHAQTP